MEDFFEGYSNTISFLAALATISTLILAYLINNKFGKNYIRTKQIDHIINLIDTLNNSRIQVSFSTYNKDGAFGGSGFGIAFNIFEIAGYNSADPLGYNTEYDDEMVLFNKECNQMLNIRQYIDNPLTPRNIADSLLNFYNSSARYIPINEANKELNRFVAIRTDIFEKNVIFSEQADKFLIQGDGSAFASWLNLKIHSQNLKNEIGSWLIENGINENNMREDFKNRL